MSDRYYRVPKWLFWLTLGIVNGMFTVWHITRHEWGWAALGTAATVSSLYWAWEER